jgi:hypothetical protein
LELNLCFRVAGHKAAETKCIIIVAEIKEHYAQIKNTYYFCIYPTCIPYYFKTEFKHFFKSLLLEKWGAQLIQWCRIFKKIWYLH